MARTLNRHYFRAEIISIIIRQNKLLEDGGKKNMRVIKSVCKSKIEKHYSCKCNVPETP